MKNRIYFIYFLQSSAATTLSFLHFPYRLNIGDDVDKDDACIVDAKSSLFFFFLLLDGCYCYIFESWEAHEYKYFTIFSILCHIIADGF